MANTREQSMFLITLLYGISNLKTVFHGCFHLFLPSGEPVDVFLDLSHYSEDYWAKPGRTRNILNKGQQRPVFSRMKTTFGLLLENKIPTHVRGVALIVFAHILYGYETDSS